MQYFGARQRQAGPVLLLPRPSRPWESISMDLVGAHLGQNLERLFVRCGRLLQQDDDPYFLQKGHYRSNQVTLHTCAEILWFNFIQFQTETSNFLGISRGPCGG